MKKLLLGILAVTIVFTVTYIVKNMRQENSTPPILVEDFVDLTKIEKISKFRSCQGHIVIPIDESETKRNMKHYVLIKPEFQGKKMVELYAPFDGKVVGTFSSPANGLEGEVWLGNESEWAFSIEHIHLLDSIKEGKKVKAGDLLGYAGDRGFDIVYAVGAQTPKVIDGYRSPFAKLDSVFSHMDTAAFAKYQELGITDKESFAYTKEYRDQNPCEYRDDRGGLNDVDHPEDWIFLNSQCSQDSDCPPNVRGNCRQDSQANCMPSEVKCKNGKCLEVFIGTNDPQE